MTLPWPSGRSSLFDGVAAEAIEELSQHAASRDYPAGEAAMAAALPSLREIARPT